MAYSRGTSANIIVGAAALFTYEDGPIGQNTSGGITNTQAELDLPNFQTNISYKETLSNDVDFRNVGYTMNGLEIVFQPDFGEVQVDQVLDVAKLYKQGMQVNLNTAFAEATLDNLLFAIAGQSSDLSATYTSATSQSAFGTPTYDGDRVLNLGAGNIGECPVERGLVAVGPGTGDCAAGSSIERVYVGYRALSIESVTVSAKRDEATMFEVSFRLLPNDNASYGKIVDRTLAS
jgi:hypothetical protein